MVSRFSKTTFDLPLPLVPRVVYEDTPLFHGSRRTLPTPSVLLGKTNSQVTGYYRHRLFKYVLAIVFGYTCSIDACFDNIPLRTLLISPTLSQH
jgi:hypothetical protein